MARRIVRYDYVYPFAEAAVAILMIAVGIWGVIVATIALITGRIGAISVVKTVYIEKRDLKCACVGSGANLPL